MLPVPVAVVAVQAAQLLRLLFVCPGHVHASTDLMQSVPGDYKLPADQLSPSQLSLHKILQQITNMQ